MADTTPPDSLNNLSTHWAEIVAAHGDGPSAHQAQTVVLRRYCRAVYRYLAATTGDVHAADDLAQEFALRFVRGDFHRLHPERGRFRDFVRTVLSHLVADHYRRRKTAPKPLPPDGAAVAPDAGPEFADCWRQELLDRAWSELQQVQARAGVPLYAALRGRAEHPDRRSAAAAAELSQSLGRPVTAVAYRQVLHRARVKFAELLRAEVAFSLGTDEASQVEEELADLGFLVYCRPRASGVPGASP
jgi:RNA polymerase sigma-70 factor (ECF subfamily)